MSTPMLSITLTNYNYEPYIEQAIESILEQSFKDFELIILDNASSDQSSAIIRSYAARDRRIRAIFHSHNIGAQQNLIMSCTLARGRYRLHIDADDYLLDTQACEQMVDLLEQHSDMTFVYPMITDINADNQVISTLRAYDVDTVLPGGAALDRVVHLFVPHSGTMLRMSAYHACGGYDVTYQHCDDVKLWVDLCLYGAVGYINKPLLARRIHSNAITSNTTAFPIRLREEELERIVETVITGPLRTTMKNPEATRQHLLGAVLTAYPTSAIFAGNYRAGWQYLLESIRRHPRAVLTHRQTTILLARTCLGASGLRAAQRTFAKLLNFRSTNSDVAPTNETYIVADAN